ncbi:MAG: hypothetical protein ACMUIM_02065 [bacterium]
MKEKAIEDSGLKFQRLKGEDGQSLLKQILAGRTFLQLLQSLVSIEMILVFHPHLVARSIYEYPEESGWRFYWSAFHFSPVEPMISPEIVINLPKN